MFALIRCMIGFMEPVVLHPACAEVLFCSSNLEDCKNAMSIADQESGTFLAIMEYDPNTQIMNKKPILSR